MTTRRRPARAGKAKKVWTIDALLAEIDALDVRRHEFEVAVNDSIKMVCDRVDELTGHARAYRDAVGRAEFDSRVGPLASDVLALKPSVAACETRAKDQEAAISELDKDVQVHARTLEDVDERIAALETAGSRSRDEGVATPTEREASKGGNPAPVGSDPAPATPPAPRAFRKGDRMKLTYTETIVEATEDESAGEVRAITVEPHGDLKTGEIATHDRGDLVLVRAAPEAPPAAAPAPEKPPEPSPPREPDAALVEELAEIVFDSARVQYDVSRPHHGLARWREAASWNKDAARASTRAVLAKLRELSWTPSSGALMSLRAEVDRLRAENRKLGEEIADMTKKRDYLLGEFTALKARRVRRTRAVTKEDAREFMEYPAGVRETCRALGFRRVVEEKGGGS